MTPYGQTVTNHVLHRLVPISRNCPRRNTILSMPPHKGHIQNKIARLFGVPQVSSAIKRAASQLSPTKLKAVLTPRKKHKSCKVYDGIEKENVRVSCIKLLNHICDNWTRQNARSASLGWSSGSPGKDASDSFFSLPRKRAVFTHTCVF